MKWVILFLSLMASSATAQAVIVKSGDHADFTRLVLTFPDSTEWTLGRTESGYELGRVGRKEAYDLTDVYRLITKARLKSIWTDPASGRLRLVLACACHAIPFEFSRNTLVIDIKDGAPPPGSVFEQPFAGGRTMPPLGSEATAKTSNSPEPRYDWLASSEKGSNPENSASIVGALPSNLGAAVAGDSFRTAIIDQLAKGATDGVVKIVPSGLGERSDNPPVDTENVRIILGDQTDPIPGVSVSDGKTQPVLTEKGRICPPQDQVDLAGWTTGDSGIDALTVARNAMLGEFDEPSPEGIQAATRAYLYLGFGAEARNLMSVFQSGDAIDPLLLGLSYLVDGDFAPDMPFKGLQTCDSAAAFWALAAAKEGEDLPGLNGRAVAGTFLTLPQHLKIAFAKTITERLLRVGDTANAEIVRAALGRSSPNDTGIVPLVEAEIALHEGSPESAESHLDDVSDNNVVADALLKRVEARFQQRLGVDANDVLAIEAFAFQDNGGASETKYQEALAHAKALNGDFVAAFEQAGENRKLREDTWAIMAASGKESDLLTHVVGRGFHPDDPISAETKTAFVHRLMDLGLPNAAEDWLPKNPSDPILTAEVALANKDGRTALRWLASDLASADPALLAEAFAETGEFRQAASVLRDEGKAEDARRLERWDGVWTPVEVSEPDASAPGSMPAEKPESTDVWDRVVNMRNSIPQDEARPPLEAGQKHLEDSASTRDRIAALLTAVPEVK